MHTFTKTVSFLNTPHMMKGVPVAAAIAGYFKSAHGMEMHVLTPTLGGHPSRAVFTVNFEDLSQFQATMGKAMQDKTYIDLVLQLTEHIDGGKTVDQVWRVAA